VGAINSSISTTTGVVVGDEISVDWLLRRLQSARNTLDAILSPTFFLVQYPLEGYESHLTLIFLEKDKKI